MRIIYYSDVHTDVRKSMTIPESWIRTYPLNLGPDLEQFLGSVDLVILAGDIGTIREVLDTSVLAYAQQVSDYLSCPVVLVPGNHEYYGGVFPDDLDLLLRKQTPGVTTLDRGVAYFPHPEGQLRILGATLWTDYSILAGSAASMDLARTHIADHRRIFTADGGRFRPEDALAEHLKSRDWISARLAETHVGPTIVVTHHVPHLAARNRAFPPGDLYLPAFCSDRSDLVSAAAVQRVSAWIFGHHHYCLDMTVLGVRLLSAQLGYPGEETGWRGPGRLSV